MTYECTCADKLAKRDPSAPRISYLGCILLSGSLRALREWHIRREALKSLAIHGYSDSTIRHGFKNRDVRHPGLDARIQKLESLTGRRT
jgi:hypothetical protein